MSTSNSRRAPQNAASSADCVALAREALQHARAFRRSVAAFDDINIDAIFGELKQIRNSVRT